MLTGANDRPDRARERECARWQSREGGYCDSRGADKKESGKTRSARVGLLLAARLHVALVLALALGRLALRGLAAALGLGLLLG